MDDKDAKFLICDDSILARKNLSAMLKSFGYTNIIEVSNGQDAVNAYMHEHPTVALLDIVMPIKDGVTATREILEYDPKAIVIMVSSVGTQTNLREAIKAGAKDFIQKPVEEDLLEEVLNHVLNG
ncbi:MAG: response regulator [Lachnospiraceae bacterium]|nr:response regulator [Lachnospiraceae bacterium]